MGNFFSFSNSRSNYISFGVPIDFQKPSFKLLNGTKNRFFEAGDSNSAVKTHKSCGKFNTNRSSSFPSFTRPGSRVSRRKWDEKTLADPLSCSKTTWPVPLIVALFLPEFKIKNKVSEDSFQVIGILSSGAFSKVYKVLKCDSNEEYAMKVLSKGDLVANNLVNQVKEEVKIQEVVGHNSFIVNCPYYWQSRKKLFIVSEYVSGGELFKLVQDNGPLPLDIIKLYTAELALALDFLHNAGVIYRDLKMENILLNFKGHIQLIDFGLSKWLKYGMRTNTICGTSQYIAPEILQLKPYGHAVDWWSLGIVLVCMILGQCPYESCINENGDVRPIPEMDCCDEAKDLVHRLLVADPTKRLRSLTALKRTALFKDYDFETVLDFVVDLKSLTVMKLAMVVKS